VGDGLGEVGVAASPVVNHLGALHTDSGGDLSGSDELLGVDAATHVVDAREGF
jgi:hypothetical protein